MSQHMKVILRIAGGLLLVGLVSLLVFYVLYAPVCSSGPEPAATPDSAWMPNPASAYCEEQGGRIEIRTTADGDQYGVCILPDGSEREDWAFYRNECSPGGKTSEAPELILAPNPAVFSPGQPIKVTGSGFAPETGIALRLGVPSAGLSKENLATVVVDAHGVFAVELTLPTEWPGAQTPIIERELVIAAVDEVRGQTLAVAQFTNEEGLSVECFDDCMIFARDVALAYITAHYGGRATAPDLVWEQTSMAESIAPEGSSGELTYQFIADGWVTTVSYPIGGPGPVVYVVEVTNQGTGFRWQGTVDRHANVTEQLVGGAQGS